MAIKGDTLTEKEMQVLLCVADGMTYPQIAAEFGKSAGTIAEHVKSIRDKLGAKNMANAVAIAYHKGILEVPMLKLYYNE
jgi:DNA-binding CsgD family transcriptional regulator